MTCRIQAQQPLVNVGKIEMLTTEEKFDRQHMIVGCHGDDHLPRPYVGDPPGPRAIRCYCGAKTWIIEACPTCGHDRAVSR